MKIVNESRKYSKRCGESCPVVKYLLCGCGGVWGCCGGCGCSTGSGRGCYHSSKIFRKIIVVLNVVFAFSSCQLAILVVLIQTVILNCTVLRHRGLLNIKNQTIVGTKYQFFSHLMCVPYLHHSIVNIGANQRIFSVGGVLLLKRYLSFKIFPKLTILEYNV